MPVTSRERKREGGEGVLTKAGMASPYANACPDPEPGLAEFVSRSAMVPNKATP